jgi:DNA-binding response OmpR family regulator
MSAAAETAPRCVVMATRVLTVEDDERIRSVMRLALEDEGYMVSEAATGEEAVEMFGSGGYDVVLVDLMLPGISGFDVCRKLRRGSDVPIVIVTAKADTHDVVAGLEAGADDYVTKPFVGKELAARIRALLRRVRSTDTTAPTLEFGDLRVARAAGEVTVGGRPVALTKTEFRLLCELAENAGLVLSREQLLERVWDYGYFGDGRLVDAHIRRLRTKIETDPAQPRHVVTVRGLGYKLQP